MTDICEDVIHGEEAILATAILEADSALSWAVKPEMPELDEHHQRVMSIEVNIIMTLVKKNQDYLGAMDFVMVRQKMADVFLFPVPGRPKRTFCMVVKRPYDQERLVKKVQELLGSG